jgi:methyl halide transferase
VNKDELPQLDAEYWDKRWKEQNTGWDIGTASPAITHYIDRYATKNAAVLIPGCGSAYEAAYLVQLGFTNVTLLEIAPAAAQMLAQKFSDTPQINVLCADFFQHIGTYDLMLEQTFFCAINPELRTAYVKQAHNLLAPLGKIVGVLFNKIFENEGPPFGGTEAEYKKLFAPLFQIKTMAACYNSIAPRSGTELFIQLIKK